jgi:hypothetical protein
MKITSIAIALLALLAGLAAAFFWRKASKVLVVPAGIGFAGLHEVELWLPTIVQTFEKAGRLNKIAAIWTAIAVALGAIGSVVSALAT